MSNADLMQEYVGKTIAGVKREDIGLDDWTNPDGVVIHFTDGTSVTLTADMGQGVGFLIVLDEGEG